MPQNVSSNARQALTVAVRSGVVTFCVVVCGSLGRILINGLFDKKWYLNWGLVFVLSGVSSIAVFLWTLLSSYISLRSVAPSGSILDRVPSLSLAPDHSMSGFVGMEYYAFILNRTFVVFAGAEGLFGWKAEGPVSAANPAYFEPYEKMLEDPNLMRDESAIKNLSMLNGGFFIPDASITSIEASDRSKWGMGGIPNSGRIRIHLIDGTSREFILLGTVSPEAIRDRTQLSLAQ
jgi:hypothetical protein